MRSTRFGGHRGTNPPPPLTRKRFDSTVTFEVTDSIRSVEQWGKVWDDLA